MWNAKTCKKLWKETLKCRDIPFFYPCGFCGQCPPFLQDKDFLPIILIMGTNWNTRKIWKASSLLCRWWSSLLGSPEAVGAPSWAILKSLGVAACAGPGRGCRAANPRALSLPPEPVFATSAREAPAHGAALGAPALRSGARQRRWTRVSPPRWLCLGAANVLMKRSARAQVC